MFEISDIKSNFQKIKRGKKVVILAPFCHVGKMTEDEMAGWHHRLDGRESE